MIAIPADAECVLQSDRLLLTPIVVSDAEALFELLKEPSLYSFIGGPPPASVEVVRERIRWWEKRHSPNGDEVWLNWTVRLKEPDGVVGHFQASVRATQADLAWVIGLPFQRRGYATEAARAVAEWLKKRFALRELQAKIHTDHIASQRIAERIGLQRPSETTPQGEQIWTAIDGSQ